MVRTQKVMDGYSLFFKNEGKPYTTAVNGRFSISKNPPKKATVDAAESTSGKAITVKKIQIIWEE